LTQFDYFIRLLALYFLKLTYAQLWQTACDDFVFVRMTTRNIELAMPGCLPRLDGKPATGSFALGYVTPSGTKGSVKKEIER
jgi:hypothetical protein